MNFKGLFITLEGGEGSGKTTILKMIQDTLVNQGFNVLQTREPGGVSISEDIRNIILDTNNTQMDSKTEALLYAASRRQHLVEKVIPSLDRGEIVISDRYIDSSLVYQGYARGIGINEVFDLNMFAIDNILPNLTLIFDIDPSIGLSRISKNDKREINRLDLEKAAFHSQVREGYKKIASMFPERIRLIDASKSIVEVYHDCMNYIDEIIKQNYHNE